MNEKPQACTITKRTATKGAMSNNVIESQEVTVTGETLDACKKIFDEVWKC